MKNLIIYLFAILYFDLNSQSWQYIAQPLPKKSAEVFAKNKVSTQYNERDLAVSPDGKEIYYTLVASQSLSIIMVRKYINEKWQKPQIAPFSGGFSDLEPAFSPDGKKLFFASNRQSNTGGIKDFDIWVVKKNDQGVWSDPENVGSEVNTTANEYYPSVAKNGTLYWTAPYAGGFGGEDIWFSKFENGLFAKRMLLPAAINGRTNEFNAYIHPDEKYIIFGSEKRSDETGGGDMYISYFRNGNWTTAKNMGSSVNTPGLDYCPFVSTDGKYFFYTSTQSSTNEKANLLKGNTLLKSINASGAGRGDIYWVDASAVIEN